MLFKNFQLSSDWTPPKDLLMPSSQATHTGTRAAAPLRVHKKIERMSLKVVPVAFFRHPWNLTRISIAEEHDSAN